MNPRKHCNIVAVVIYFIICCQTSTRLVVKADAQGHCTINKSTGFVNCRNRNLIAVPTNIPSETKVIDLSENGIQYLNVSAFKCCSFITEVYLNKNNLSYINYGAFSNLQHLKLLDVSDNLLSNFQVDIPVSLEILYLNNNPLSNGNVFQQRLLFLKYLSLAGTQLTEPSIFSNFLPVLQFLDLQNITSLSITTDDLKKLSHLKILYISPRVYSGRSKSQKCREFIQSTKSFKVEVKAFACSPQENFDIKAKSFERVYQVDEAMHDYPDNILNKGTNETCLHDLQTLVSDGVTNFIKSLMIERKELQGSTSFKIRDPLKLEDFSTSPQITLTDAYLSGFPTLKMKNEPVLSFSSSDAEEVKRFRVLYKTNENKRNIVVIGDFNFYNVYGNFTCKFTNTNYETARQMVRRYDFRVWPTNIRERLEFEMMDCQASISDHLDMVIDVVLTALSKSWLDSVTRIANAVSIDTKINDIGATFSNIYRNRILSKVIGQVLEYLKNINVNSFDVTPSITTGDENDTDGFHFALSNNSYNVKINNLFNHSNNNISYSVSEEESALNVLGKYAVFYERSPAVLSISAKDNPSDIMNITISSIEYGVHFEVKTIDKVNKLNIANVNTMVIEKQAERSLIFLVLKKYLCIELAKEFKRSLIYLTSKIDFYSLNVL